MKRWWGIRHIRWLYGCYQLSRWVARCQNIGLGFSASQSDIRRLDAILKGDR